MARSNDNSAHEDVNLGNLTSDAALWPSLLPERSLTEQRQSIFRMEAAQAISSNSLPNLTLCPAGEGRSLQAAQEAPLPDPTLTPRPTDLIPVPVAPPVPVVQPLIARPVEIAPPPAPGADRVVPQNDAIPRYITPAFDPNHPPILVDRYSGAVTTLNWQPNGKSAEGSQLEIGKMEDSRGVWQRGHNSDRVLNDAWTNPQATAWRGTVEMRQGQLVETHIADNGAVLDTRTYNPTEGRVTTQWQDQQFGTVVREDRSNAPTNHTIRFSGATVQVNDATGEATWIDDTTQQRWQGRVQIQADGSPYFIETPAAQVEPSGSTGAHSPEAAPYQPFQSPCARGQCPTSGPRRGRR